MDHEVEREERLARHVNLALTAWLVVSSFAWRHEGLRLVVTSLVGALVVGLAPSAVGLSRLQGFNTAAGLALAAAALALPRNPSTTAWINVIVGLVIAAVSLLPSREGFHTPHPVRAWRARHRRR